MQVNQVILKKTQKNVIGKLNTKSRQINSTENGWKHKTDWITAEGNGVDDHRMISSIKEEAVKRAFSMR